MSNSLSKPAVLVTGGAGYIGSHACKALAKRGFEPIVFDNLSAGHEWAVRWGPLVQGELSDTVLLRDVIRSCQIDCILHFAASAIVSESMQDPHHYFRNNLGGTLSLLEAALTEGATKLVFSSTCATYGIPREVPISEQHPQQPINPYGESKLAIERMLRWHNRLSQLNTVTLRYFNAAGADPDGEIGEEHEPETHLIPRILMAAAGDLPSVPVYGTDFPTPDGTCIRDYVHVTDLADAHVRALDYLLHDGEPISMNLGTGKGASVLEVIQAAEQVTGVTISRDLRPPQSGDPAALIADSALAHQVLGWKPKLSSVESVVRTAWLWKTQHRQARLQDLPGAALIAGDLQ